MILPEVNRTATESIKGIKLVYVAGIRDAILLSEGCEFPAGYFEYDHVVSRCMVCTAAVFGLIDKKHR